MSKHYMFAYGANTNINNMHERCPGARLLARTWIDGYAFRWRGTADIEIDPDSYVIGMLWAIDDSDLAMLDRFEGYPDIYFRQRVLINHGDHQVIGWAYMMCNQNSESSPTDSYRESVYEGYRQNDLADDQLTHALSRLEPR